MVKPCVEEITPWNLVVGHASAHPAHTELGYEGFDERVQSRTIDDSGLMPDEHTPTVIEAVDNDSSCITKTYLEHRLLVLPPPLFAHCSVVISKLKQMPDDRLSVGYLEYAPNLRLVGQCGKLRVSVPEQHRSAR